MYTIETLPHSNFVDSTILLIAIRFHYFSLLWREWVQNICVVPPCHSYLFVFLHFHDGLILCAAPSRFHMAYKAYLCAILPNSLAIDLSNESDSSEFGNRIATLNIELGWVRSNLNLAWYARIGRIISWAYSFLSSHIEMPSVSNSIGIGGSRINDSIGCELPQREKSFLSLSSWLGESTVIW